MCDYSLTNVQSRPAKVGDELITRNFGTGTVGLSDLQDPTTAVCLLPGTELAFDKPIAPKESWGGQTGSKVARFDQVHKENKHQHHDALVMPNGYVLLLTSMPPGRTCRVLQLPASPKTKKEVEEQRRAEYAG